MAEMSGLRSTLAPRELQVLRLTANGLTREEVAAHQGVTLETVKTQLKWCREKLNARSTTHAVALGFQEGWLR